MSNIFSSKKMKLSIVGLLVLAYFTFAFPLVSSAASFNFTFNPPFTGSLKSTSKVTVSSGLPYVNPSHSATPTSYFLSPTPGTAIEATNFITNISTSGTRFFTYKSGYGGTGQQYVLSAHPSNFDFVKYTVKGNWKP